MYRIGDREIRLKKSTLRDYEVLKEIFRGTGIELNVIPASPAELVVNVSGLLMALIEKGKMAQLMSVLCEPADGEKEIDWMAMDEEVATTVLMDFIKKKVSLMHGFVTGLLPLLMPKDQAKENTNL